MTTTELIELLKKHERGGATGLPREVMFEVDDRIIDTDGIEVTGSGDGLISELYLSLPSAQPEQIARDIATIIENEQDMRVILQNAEHTETHSCDYQRTETHDSCTDCPLYDHDRHNCPRFNKVIPTAIPDAQQRWIPIKWHDCTDEEREEYGFAEEIVAVFDCEMPKDKQEILVTTSHGYVEQDVCYIDDGFSLDSGYDWIEDITAWMPKPAPYKEEQE